MYIKCTRYLNCYNEWLLFIIRNLEDNYVSIPYVSFYHIYQELELYSLLNIIIKWMCYYIHKLFL